MSRSPRSTASRSHGSALSIVPIASSMSSARLGAPPCSGPDSAPMAPTTAAARSAPVDVITRAVNVDALKPWSIVEMRYCSTARACSGVGNLALHHVEVVRRVREVGVRVDRLEAVLQPVQRGEQRGHDRARLERLVAQLGASTSSDGRKPSAAPSSDTVGAQQVERRRVGPPSARSAGSTAFTAAGISRSGAISVGNASRSAQRRERALEQQVPHVFERALLRELDRVVLAVVVEAFEAAHVADRGLGDDDAFEARGTSCGEVLGRLDLRDAHEVAHRHDADELRRRRRPGCAGSRARRGWRTPGARVDVGADGVGVGVIHSDTAPSACRRRRRRSGRGRAR